MQDNLQEVKPPFRRSAEAEKVFALLEKGAIGNIVNYERLRDLVDEDPQIGSGYAIIKGVRDRLVRELGHVWFVLPGIGLKRANPDEVVELADAGIESLRRRNQRNGMLIKTIDPDQLEGEARAEFNFLSSIIGTLGLFFGRKERRQLKQETVSAPIDSKKVLQLFQKGE